MGALDVEHIESLESSAKLDPFHVDADDCLAMDPIEDAVKVLLDGLGEDTTREGLVKTPFRVAKALREGTRGYRQTVKQIVDGALFPEAGWDDEVGHAGGAGGLVVVREIDLFSYCESCLLPFKAECHIGYIPSGECVVGLSKLARAADVFARRLQAPQRLAREICSSLQSAIRPAGVAVFLNCWHLKFPSQEYFINGLCHQSKECNHGWVPICVLAGSGAFEDVESDEVADFFAVLKFKGLKLPWKGKTDTFWCPSKSLSLPLCNGHSVSGLINRKFSGLDGSVLRSMISAVVSILRCLGEDPSREELTGTPYRFLQWLIKFHKGNVEVRLNGSTPLCSLRKYNESGYHPDKFHSEVNLPFWSQCEHHLLPFYGVVHVGHLQKDRSGHLDRSFLLSIVQFIGCKLQVQERFTRQIAEIISVHSGLGDLIVVVEASHICMISRGIEKVGSSTATVAVRGLFSTDHKIKAAFLETISENHQITLP